AFPWLSEDELAQVTPRLRNIRFPAGKRLVTEGQPSTQSYVLVRGEVDLVRATLDGGEARVARVGPGQLLGDPDPSPDLPSAVSVVTATAVDVLALDNDTLRALARPPVVTSNGLPQALQVLRERLAEEARARTVDSSAHRDQVRT
ncbi:MAG: cyclic nucleotide-binding domain-containing protein, partial [Actinomycetota bacterium]|nr:cyclic nucleotide-binding domain-containing protein [Actinomycetota bacterium]